MTDNVHCSKEECTYFYGGFCDSDDLRIVDGKCASFVSNQRFAVSDNDRLRSENRELRKLVRDLYKCSQKKDIKACFSCKYYQPISGIEYACFSFEPLEELEIEVKRHG